VPHVSTPLQPTLLATRSGAATASAPRPGHFSWLNWLLGKLLLEPFGWRLVGELQNRFRRDVLGLPAQTRRQNAQRLARALVVQGFSEHVVPHPPDWPERVHTTGYWFLDEGRDWLPPEPLERFLEAGEPPVYIGFGSMTGHDPERVTRLLLDAVRLSGRRAVLQSGWASLGSGAPLPDAVFLLDAAPHARLFPRMAAVVHHGGAGTTGEGLRAGVPTLIVPHMADQPFWGSRVAALGVGPAPIPRNRLTPERLANAIRQAATDPGMRERAVALGQRIRAQDGVGTAVALIERHLRA
jgi:UDP:flavonoid glycosyltransferase YjiC (YdhE family)